MFPLTRVRDLHTSCLDFSRAACYNILLAFNIVFLVVVMSIFWSIIRRFRLPSFWAIQKPFQLLWVKYITKKVTSTSTELTKFVVAFIVEDDYYSWFRIYGNFYEEINGKKNLNGTYLQSRLIRNIRRYPLQIMDINSLFINTIYLYEMFFFFCWKRWFVSNVSDYHWFTHFVSSTGLLSNHILRLTSHDVLLLGDFLPFIFPCRMHCRRLYLCFFRIIMS
jgi:hypothetical protein